MTKSTASCGVICVFIICLKFYIQIKRYNCHCSLIRAAWGLSVEYIAKKNKFTVVKSGQKLCFTLGSYFYSVCIVMLYMLAHFVVLQNPLGTLAGVHVSINTENKLMVIAISH